MTATAQHAIIYKLFEHCWLKKANKMISTVYLIEENKPLAFKHKGLRPELNKSIHNVNKLIIEKTLIRSGKFDVVEVPQ